MAFRTRRKVLCVVQLTENNYSTYALISSSEMGSMSLWCRANDWGGYCCLFFVFDIATITRRLAARNQHSRSHPPVDTLWGALPLSKSKTVLQYVQFCTLCGRPTFRVYEGSSITDGLIGKGNRPRSRGRADEGDREREKCSKK